MPLSLPNLDDRTFSDLVAEMQSLIPRYARKWTNYNPADPGITFLELLSWLTETVLYRLDLVQERSYLTFLELLGIEPAAPRVVLTFTIAAAEDALPAQFEIPRGTRFAGIEESTNTELIFETLSRVKKEAGKYYRETGRWVFKAAAVNTIEVEEELLGVSNGLPKQRFHFKQQPVFINKNDQSYPGNQPPDITDVYRGNPRIVVYTKAGHEQWVYQHDLLQSTGDPASDEKTENGLPNTGLLHFTVEQLAGCVRFGDGIRGKIPEDAAEIVCTYRIAGGAKANLKAGRITILKDTAFLTGLGINPLLAAVANEYPVTGGVDSESLDDLLESGLKTIQEQYRAVSDKDFENLTLLQAAPGKAARVKVVPDVNLETMAAPAGGHVSVIVLPDAGFLNLSEISKHTFQELQPAVESAAAQSLYRDILQFLDSRRLITTQVHVVAPRFVGIDLEIKAKAKPGIQTGDLKTKITERLVVFLDPYQGGEDGEGWPFGSNVYRSALYQQIESIEGVDYVESLYLNGQPHNNYIEVKENYLVCARDIRCI